MKYRHAEILTPQDLGPAGTEIIDVPTVDPISAMTLLFYPNGGSNTIIAHPVACIEKIELVDGSDVLLSLTGYQAHALDILQAKVPRATYMDCRTSAQPLIRIDLNFGRWLWDPELALDPKKFANPQIKLTWDEDAYDASVTAHTFAIYGHLFDEKTVVPTGFLMAKEIKSYEPSSGGYEYTDLPTDHLLRALVIQGFKKGAGVRGLCEDIRISEDNDKRIPLDGDIYYLRSFLDGMSGEAVDTIKVTAAATPTEMYVTPHNVLAGVVTNDTADLVARLYPYSGGYVIVESETAAHRISALVRGKNPHGCIAIPFGNPDDMDDWYDVTTLGSLKVRIKGGSSSASGDAVRIVTQQLRKYA
jgi:hypothetical protein